MLKSARVNPAAFGRHQDQVFNFANNGVRYQYCSVR